jgi:hypothetical protein
VLAVGLLALLPFVAVLVWPSGDLLRREPLGGFYDAQAHSLLQGHWYVDPSVAGIEGYDVKGHTQIYFGPVLAIVRMPLLAITSRFDGRLTRVSLLLADLLLIVALARLTVWTARFLLGDRPRGPGLTFLAALNVLALATSVPLLLTSNAWVYHEAILWGAALAVTSFWLLVAHLATRRPAPLVGAAVLACLASLTRASVGLGPLVALLLLAAWRLWELRRAQRAAPAPGADHDADAGADPIAPGADGTTRPARLAVIVAVAALVVTGGLYVAVNQARFGTPLRVPYEQQRFSAGNLARKRSLAANGNSLTSVVFIPTQLLQAVRPDALRLRSTFPFVDFPHGQATLIGNAVFEDRSATVSLPASAPLPALLAVAGLVVLVLGRRRLHEASVEWRLLWIPLVGAAVGTLGVLTFADISARYLGDAIPLLAVGSVIGAVGLGTVAAREPAHRGGARQAAWAGMGVLAVALTLGGTWVNAGLAVDYRYDHGLTQPFPDARTWSRVQVAVARALHGSAAPPWVVRLTSLRPSAPPGTLGVLDDCRGVYRRVGSAWTVVDGKPLVSEALVTAPARNGSPADVTLVRLKGVTGTTSLVLRPTDHRHGRVVLTFRGPTSHLEWPGDTVTWTGDVRPQLHVMLDSPTGSAEVLRGDTVLLSAGAPVPAVPLAAGSKAVTLDPSGGSFCAQLDDALHLAGR